MITPLPTSYANSMTMRCSSCGKNVVILAFKNKATLMAAYDLLRQVDVHSNCMQCASAAEVEGKMNPSRIMEVG